MRDAAINIKQAALKYIAVRRTRGEFTASTAKTNRATLFEFADAVGNPQISALRPRHVERWFARHGRLAPATRQQRFSQINVFLEFAIMQRWLKQHPMIGFRAPKMPRYQPRCLTAADAGKVLRAATDERERVLVLLGLQEGLRCCEMVNLQLADVDLEQQLLRVVGKGGHERYVPLSDQTRFAIREYLALYPTSVGPLVRSYQNPTRAITPGRVSYLLSRVHRDAGVKTAPNDGRSAHALRHTAANDVLEHSGGDVRLVMEFLGHQSLQTTSRYTKRFQAIGKLREAAAGRSY